LNPLTPRSYDCARFSSLVNALKDQLERREKGNTVMVRFRAGHPCPVHGPYLCGLESPDGQAFPQYDELDLPKTPRSIEAVGGRDTFGQSLEARKDAPPFVF
jgi:hypothetical protein